MSNSAMTKSGSEIYSKSTHLTVCSKGLKPDPLCCSLLASP